MTSKKKSCSVNEDNMDNYYVYLKTEADNTNKNANIGKFVSFLRLISSSSNLSITLYRGNKNRDGYMTISIAKTSATFAILTIERDQFLDFYLDESISEKKEICLNAESFHEWLNNCKKDKSSLVFSIAKNNKTQLNVISDCTDIRRCTSFILNDGNISASDFPPRTEVDSRVTINLNYLADNCKCYDKRINLIVTNEGLYISPNDYNNMQKEYVLMKVDTEDDQKSKSQISITRYPKKGTKESKMPPIAINIKPSIIAHLAKLGSSAISLYFAEDEMGKGYSNNIHVHYTFNPLGEVDAVIMACTNMIDETKENIYEVDEAVIVNIGSDSDEDE